MLLKAFVILIILIKKIRSRSALFSHTQLMSDQIGKRRNQVSSSKSVPFGAARTYIAYIRKLKGQYHAIFSNILKIERTLFG